MNITFYNPGINYSLHQIMLFQTEEETDYWASPLYYFYPELNEDYAKNLSASEKTLYIEKILKKVYAEAVSEINEKIYLYTKHWDECSPQINAALSDAFGIDCRKLFCRLRCNITLNPVSPRFLREEYFDIFYLNSERGAVGQCIHEIIHFVWFYVWHELFKDSYKDYERPSLQWILSEMVVEAIMSDPRLSSVNPYYPREHGGCIYNYFFTMTIGGIPILDTIEEMYKNLTMKEFMKASYHYCRKHEQEIRKHILISEKNKERR